ncbi:MAG: hypothetical protein KDE53_40595 [Caldilineaceae bacterium]|nr:hypothetical protein [Caldilineaceae bacterium]MCB0122429.1 hypothetical protein [Caldilineaceae bacterium]
MGPKWCVFSDECVSPADNEFAHPDRPFCSTIYRDSALSLACHHRLCQPCFINLMLRS